jgi:mono/diheme cytochrome c family protein
MPTKKKRAVLMSSLIVAVSVAMFGLAAAGWDRRSPAPQADVARGKYLVEEVAKCPECHTPRDSAGQLDPHAWLQGAPIWITPTKPTANWADYAPVLAGLPSYTDQQVENVLEKGIGPNGEAIRPPMHIYHMDDADAKAIIAYLKSLPAKKR